MWEFSTNSDLKKKFWKWNPQRVKFLIEGVYNVLPSPSNLLSWGKAGTPACPLCSKAPGEGHYCWKHDQVLKTIAEPLQAPARMVVFVKEEEWPKKRPKGWFVCSPLHETECRRNGRRTRCMSGEVGRQGGFPWGIRGASRRRAILELARKHLDGCG